MSVNQEKLNQLLETMVAELGAAFNSSLVLIGDKLGLYRTLAASDGLNAAELAARTECHSRYVQEWLAAQAASGFVAYAPESETFYMTPEQTAVFADENSPVLMTGGFYTLASVFADEPKVSQAFRSGEGISWGDHHSCLFCGVERYFRPAYQASLTSAWIPALDGVEEKLRAGARIADIGCGHAASTLIMAAAYPNSQFYGFDFHEPSIQYAQKQALKAGLTNIHFEVATAKDYPGYDYDLVTCFDCLHDMGDPAGVAAYVRQSLKPDGTWMVVEPFAYDSLEENLNPVGRIYYAASTVICTPSALSQEGGEALGAQAGEKQLRRVVTEGGFTEFRRATETPFNLILEARP